MCQDPPPAVLQDPVPCSDLNAKSVMQEIEAGVVGVPFKALSFKKISRAEKTGSTHDVAVTEVKLCLVFRVKFSIGSGELDLDVRKISLPVISTVHSNQASAAEATIM